MKSMIHLLLLFTLITSTTASVRRRLDDRHSDPPDQYDQPSAPTAPQPTIDSSAVPSVSPSRPPSKNPSLSPSNFHSKVPSSSPSFLPSDVPSPSPSFLPSKVLSPSPSSSHKPSEKKCETDKYGSFGRKTDIPVDVPFHYEMEVKQDYNDDVRALDIRAIEREINNVLVRSICSSDGKSLKVLNIVGVHASSIDDPIAKCKIQSDKGTNCWVVKGYLSVFVDNLGKKNTTADVADAVRDVIKSGMDNGEVKETSVGITSTRYMNPPALERKIVDDKDKEDDSDWPISSRILFFLLLFLLFMICCCCITGGSKKGKKEVSTVEDECDDVKEV